MERRTKLAIVILVALVLLGLGFYLLLSPYFAQKQADQQQEQQATSLPTTGTQNRPPSAANGQIQQQPVTSTAPVVLPNPMRTLERRAKAMVERIGSGTSADGFLGYQDALIDATAAEQEKLREERALLIQAHPMTGPRYGLSTRAVASNITQGNNGDAVIVATVDALQSVDAGNPRMPVQQQAKQILVTFVKQADGSYLIDNLTWSDVQL